MPGGAEDLRELKDAIDRVLFGFLDEERAEAASLDPSAAALVDEVSHVVRAGGKRLRPAFCYLGHRAAGGAHSEAILRAAASLELLHSFAILHDDVMDRAEIRRGEPAAFRRLAAARLASGERGDALQFGMSVAVLAGDLAFALSDTLLHRSGFPPHRLAEAGAILHGMRIRAVAGQYLDILGAGRPLVDAEEVRRIARLKTAAYSVEGPLLLGATLAGGSRGLKAALRAYGAAVGEMLQLRDDLMGLFGDPVKTGKDADGDIRQGKPTILLAEALLLGDDDDRRLILDLWGHPDLGVGEVDAVRAAIARTGAPEATLSLIDGLRREATAALGTEVAEPARSSLERLAALVAGETSTPAANGVPALRGREDALR